MQSKALNGAPEEIRTPDPQIRSLVLYPAELRARSHGPAGRVAAGPRTYGRRPAKGNRTPATCRRWAAAGPATVPKPAKPPQDLCKIGRVRYWRPLSLA